MLFDIIFSHRNVNNLSFCLDNWWVFIEDALAESRFIRLLQNYFAFLCQIIIITNSITINFFSLDFDGLVIARAAR